MSLIRMTNLAYNRAEADANPVVVPSGSTGKPKAEVAAEIVGKVTAFIPTEAITIYVLGTGILRNPSPEESWILFSLVALLLVPGFVILGSCAGKKRRKHSPRIGRLAILSILGIVAFASWAVALPTSPTLAVVPHAREWGVIAMAIVAAFAPFVAESLNIT